MKAFFINAVATVSLMTLFAFSSSCVHEWPEPSPTTGIDLTIHHEKEWTDYYYDAGITKAQNPWKARYIYKVFPKGKRDYSVLEHTELRDDLSLADFTTSISLPEGEWDIYVWQDFIEKSDLADKTFYDAANFKAITYTDPYTGDTDRRDAFEGSLKISVSTSIEADHRQSAKIDMFRPVAKYVFIATDFDKFFHELQTRYSQKTPPGIYPTWGQLPESERQEILKGFDIVALYPFFMPSVYNMFTQKVTDSRRNMKYKAEITPINDKYAAIAMDYVFLDTQPGSAQVALGLREPKGTIIPITSTITVPLKRSQVTYVYGPFLTTDIGSGIDIDFSFSGDFNIKI